MEGFLKEKSFELVRKEILQTHFIIFYYILILAKFQGDKKSVAISYIKCLISSFYIFKLCIKIRLCKHGKTGWDLLTQPESKFFPKKK